jgi:hypothetical protein
MIAELAARASQDDRPAIILYYSDFDPAGWQMPVSVARKLQALRDLYYSELEIEVHPIALTLQQIREWDLPSSPLKPTEARAERWGERMGHEQTEIDALAALQPEVLRSIALDAITPFHDDTLKRRTTQEWVRWKREAQAFLEAHPLYQNACPELSSTSRAVREAAANLQEAQESVERDLPGIALPEIQTPEAEIASEAPEPLFSTSHDYVTATRRLIQHKRLSEY